MKYKTLAVLITTSLTLSGCGGGGGDETTSPSVTPEPTKPTTTLPTPDAKPSKQPRMQLNVKDVEITYGEKSDITLLIQNQMGSLNYELVSTEGNNVAELDPSSNTLSILNAGKLTYKVTDTSDDYQTSSSTFTVKVKKAQAPTPLLKEVILDQKDTSRSFKVDNPVGALSIELEPSSRDLVTLQDVGGGTFMITPKRAGIATGYIVNAGNQNFNSYKIPFKIDIRKAITNNFKDIEIKYSVQPYQLPLSSEAEYSFKVNDPEIVRIDEKTGDIQPLKVGNTLVDVTYKSKFSQYTADNAHFRVTVEKGPRPNAFKASVEKDLHYSTITQQPELKLENQKGTLSYQLVSGNHISDFDSKNNSFRTTGLGNVEIKITDKSDNYIDASDTVTFQVVKADHPNFTTQIVDYTYSKLEQTVTLLGQKGTLTLKPQDTSIVKVNGNKITTLKAGIAQLEVTDTSEFYNTAKTQLTVNVAHAERDDFTVKPINQKFTATTINFSDLYKYTQDDEAVTTSPIVLIKSNPDNAIKLNQADGTLSITNAGSATLELYWPQDEQYLKSKKKSVDINIAPADSHLILAKTTIKDDYQIAPKTIAAPKVEGEKGEITYRIKQGSLKDVVSIDHNSGLMTIKNAGSTTIEILDSGNKSYKPTKATFTVQINPARADITATYPNEIALGEKAFHQPKITSQISLDKWEKLHFSIDNKTIANITNTEDGYIQVLSPGRANIVFEAISRNYYSVKKTYQIKVLKEVHPGVTAKDLNIYYTPIEQNYHIDVTSQIHGARSYLKNSSPNPIYGFKLNQDYGYVNSISNFPFSFLFKVDEKESDKYQAATDYAQAGKGVVHIYSPKPNSSDKDHTLTFSTSVKSHVIESNLNSERYKNLVRSSFFLKGTEGYYTPSKSEIDQYGNGYFTILRTKLVGDDDITARKAVRVVINRFDGCESLYNSSSSLTPAMAIRFNTDGQNDCQTTGERAKYFTKITVIDDKAMTSGEWELVNPLVIYREGKREFMDTPKGGSYITQEYNKNREEFLKSIGFDAQSKTRKVYEWNTVNLKFSI
ncbi:hypothetical protein [Photobacterium swingsii]|uniref:hypothetical protein n=1 Tax=Photobacterium swingsii TaxID=680026 RepID=UPI0040682566